MYSFLYFLGGFVTCLVLAIAYNHRANKAPKINNHLNEFKTALALIQFFCERAYELFYRLKIQPTNIIKEPLSNVEYAALRKDFYKFTLEQMGDELAKVGSFYFGGTIPLIRYISNYFEDKLMETRSTASLDLFNTSTRQGKQRLADLAKQYVEVRPDRAEGK